MRTGNLHSLPENLPVPQDDGACDHLRGAVLPSIALQSTLRLPTFTSAGLELIKRLTLIARAGRIEEVFYPVFPSDADAGRVVAWLTSHRGERAEARR